MKKVLMATLILSTSTFAQNNSFSSKAGFENIRAGESVACGRQKDFYSPEDLSLYSYLSPG